MKIKLLFILITSIFICNFAFASKFQKEIPFAKFYGIKSIEVDSEIADIKINTWDKFSIGVKATKVVLAKDSKHLNRLSFYKKQEGNVLKINSKSRYERPKDVKQNFITIYLSVPKKRSIDIENRVGDIIFENDFVGEVNVNNNKGNVIMESFDGALCVKIGDGDFSANILGFVEELKAHIKVGRGDVEIENISNLGEDSFITVNMGDIKLHSISEGCNIQASSTMGKVNYKGGAETEQKSEEMEEKLLIKAGRRDPLLEIETTMGDVEIGDFTEATKI